MDRMTILVSISAFFGASLTFQAIKAATRDSPQGVSLAIQSAALVVMIAAIVYIVRRRSKK